MTNNTEELELKAQALLERVAQLTADYENKVAELRVSLTLVARERDELSARLAEQDEAPDASAE